MTIFSFYPNNVIKIKSTEQTPHNEVKGVGLISYYSYTVTNIIADKVALNM